MKSFFTISIIIVLSLFSTACVHKTSPTQTTDLSNERWMYDVHTTPNPWVRGADSWFVSGEPNPTELSARNAPASAAISTMQVRVPNFTKIRANGAFQVQIFGTDEANSVYVYGPNAGVRSIAVEVHGDVLSIQQTQPTSAMKRVIVRIGIKNLRELMQMNCGSIEVIRVRSDHLRIITTPMASGNIYLTGCINLKSIYQGGAGSINIIGAGAPNLTITTTGSGAVNVAGNVGVESITHHGSSNINIIGANSNGLVITADGAGTIGIRGPTRLHRVRAGGATRVFAYPVKSESLSALVCDNARIGLAGYVRNLTIEVANNGRFGGKNLCAQSVYATARDMGHINTTASVKAFASASDKSSIYFFGPSTLLSQFVEGDANIVPFEGRNWCNYYSEYRDYSYTMTHPGETLVAMPMVRRPMDLKGEG